MKKILFALVVASIPLLVVAQPEPPKPVFIQPEVMSENRANALIRFTRDELFWDRAKMFDGKTTIEPANNQERQSIPIPTIDAQWLVFYGSMVGELTRCDLDGQGLSKKLFDPFWGRYQQERQIAFGLILMGVASRDVTERRKTVVCTENERENLRSVATILLQQSAPNVPVNSNSKQ